MSTPLEQLRGMKDVFATFSNNITRASYCAGELNLLAEVLTLLAGKQQLDEQAFTEFVTVLRARSEESKRELERMIDTMPSF